MIKAGTLITARQKELLLKHVSKGEVADIAEETELGHSLLLKLRSRETTITADSARGVRAMLKLALENSIKSVESSKKAKSELSKMLKQ